MCIWLDLSLDDKCMESPMLRNHSVGYGLAGGSNTLASYPFVNDVMLGS